MQTDQQEVNKAGAKRNGKRKSISKKARFEVFKRDQFACQYCGKSAPDVILHVDHISPVSKGGDNSIMNLITSCADCNSGKSNIELDDNTALAKQKKQLEELSERRAQLEMMVKWREGLRNIDQHAVDALAKQIDDHLLEMSLNEKGRKNVKSWLKKYGFKLVSDCVDISAEQYLKPDENGLSDPDSIAKFLSMIPRIAGNKVRFGDNSYMQGLYYARGILRNRINYCNDVAAINYLKRAYEATQDMEVITDIVKTVRNWTDFVATIEQLEAEG